MQDLNFKKDEFITLQIISNSNKKEILPIDNGYKVKLTKLPVKGQANKELISYFKDLGYIIEIIKGQKSNTKLIKIKEVL
ncbi:MAG TPA: DUF167 domain-containing protein [archaeon]|nr:DUF167 domain-containing protein [archaeon]HRT02905.1 DUF167 domain-containing protein [Candidatus Diapherotrites archaeon]